jgi:hypothetical protein
MDTLNHAGACGSGLHTRLTRFKDLMRRGLIKLHYCEDGSAYLTFPDHKHPDVVAFRLEGEAR